MENSWFHFFDVMNRLLFYNMDVIVLILEISKSSFRSFGLNPKLRLRRRIGLFLHIGVFPKSHMWSKLLWSFCFLTMHQNFYFSPILYVLNRDYRISRKKHHQKIIKLVIRLLKTLIPIYVHSNILRVSTQAQKLDSAHCVKIQKHIRAK